MAPTIAMSALSVGLKTEDSTTRSFVVGRSEMQTSLSMAEETVKPKVAILPFSVEALMADRKPSRDLSSSDVSAVAGSSHTHGPRMSSLSSLDNSVSSLAMGSPFSVGDIMNIQDDALVKPESPESKDRNSWIQSPRFSPTPPRKFSCFSQECLRA